MYIAVLAGWLLNWFRIVVGPKRRVQSYTHQRTKKRVIDQIRSQWTRPHFIILTVIPSFLRLERSE